MYVAELPNTKFCLFVVDKLPFPSRKVRTFARLPDMDAVGVPLFTLRKAKSALAVLVPPIKASSVLFLGNKLPLAIFQ